ncbi:conserved hypothetical protein [Desulfonatronospira thiodismutans ASO3-1]|uniref:Uncharacterized protein n=2 Tax=Desulfonatronospira TaxID=488937 RepID=D6SQ94_9BACT|nr:hypothetical protein [Desulfonatronospira thiodismutans]EFI34920.1 conserved hypothetical protein [Desulfonatronospira thiodismutans ASO3-1]
MELKLPSSRDLRSIWQESFLGQKGFFIPGERKLPIGREMKIDLVVEGSSWGSLKMVPVWANLSGPESSDLPRGTFLLLTSCEQELEKRIKSCCRS